MNDYYDVRLKEHRLKNLQSKPNFIFHQLDIESQVDLDDLFKQHTFNGVLNLAARAGVRYSLENPHVYMTTNAMGTLNLLECMRHHDVEKMVLASTSSLYAGQQMPFTEKLPVNTPISPYAASKKAAEVMCYSYHNLFQLDISVVRYFTVFGPCGRPDMSIFRFIKWIVEETPIELFGDGLQSRDFTFVDDIARGTIAALKPVGYEIFNLGGGNNPISLNQIIEWIEEALGQKAIIESKPFHKADMKSTWADISKAETKLGWKPEIDIKEGVLKFVEWYQQNQSWLKDIKL
jgi:nucleoside-diphosphate-sugar epimerase